MDEAKLVAASAIALAVTLFALFSMRPLARRVGLVDRPGERKFHRGRVPLVGGLCFFFGTVVGLLYLGYIDRFVASLLVPCALIVITGAVDDLQSLSVRSRLIIQTCAAGMVIAATGVYMDHTGQVFGAQGLELGVIGIPITIIAVIGLINAFNMLDGIDGLAASLAMVSIGAILLFTGSGWQMLGVLLLLQVLFAALVPYLFVNMGWPDGRKVFMGDAGSTLIGFLIAWSLVFLSHRGVARMAPVDALWCVALPVMDTLAVMVRRVRKGVSPFQPDRQHLHHLIEATGCSPRTTLAIIIATSGVLALSGYALRNAPEMLSGGVFVAFLACYTFGFQRALARFCRAKKLVDAVEARIAKPKAAIAPGIRDPSSLVQAVSRGDALKTLCVVATRPDAVQIAPIAQRLARDGRFDARVCVALQPPSDQAPEQVLKLFGIQPDMQLALLDRDQPHQDEADRERDLTDITSGELAQIKRVLADFQPDVVVIPGATATTFAATLAAFYQQIPVVCVEPGARSESFAYRLDGDNRRIASTLACLHFTPSESAGRHLLAEGVPADRIMVTGNTAWGTVGTAIDHVRCDVTLSRHLAERFADLRAGSPMLLVVGCEKADPVRPDSRRRHSRRSTDVGFATDISSADSRPGHALDPVWRALRTIAMLRPEADIVCPVDPCPEVTAAAQQYLQACPNVHLIAPTDYLTFAYLLDRAHLTLAATSELASQAAALGKPVLLMRSESAVAGVDAGNVRRVENHEHAIAAGVLGLLNDAAAYDAMCRVVARNGHRDACARIVEALADFQPVSKTASLKPALQPVEPSYPLESLREAS